MTTTISPAVDPTASDLLRQAAEWRLLGLLFARPRAGWSEQITALAGEIADDDLRAAAAAALSHGSQGLYDTTFGPGGPATAREVSYRKTLEPGAFLSELGAFYRAFVYPHDNDEPRDHVSVEADFVSYLLLKQLYAHMRGDPEKAEVTGHAIGQFLKEHIALIARPLRRALDHSGIDYLALAAAALDRRVAPPPESRAPDESPATSRPTQGALDAHRDDTV